MCKYRTYIEKGYEVWKMRLQLKGMQNGTGWNV